MTEREEFEEWWWSMPTIDMLGYDETSDKLRAWVAWQASRKQALSQMGAAARAQGLTLVLTARGLHLMKLGEIKGE